MVWPGNSGKRPPLLGERYKTHGDFKENARISQAMKNVGRSASGWNKMSDVQKESFDQQMLKWSRILSGRSDFRDHWDDLGGYDQLVLEEMR